MSLNKGRSRLEADIAKLQLLLDALKNVVPIIEHGDGEKTRGILWKTVEETGRLIVINAKAELAG